MRGAKLLNSSAVASGAGGTKIKEATLKRSHRNRRDIIFDHGLHRLNGFYF